MAEHTEIIVIIEEAGERVSSSEKLLEDVISSLEGEAVAASTSSHSTEVKTEALAVSPAALGQSFFAILVVDCSLVSVRETFIGFSYPLENFFGCFFVVRVFVLKEN